MATIAELRIQVDATAVEKGTQALKDFTVASEKAGQVSKKTNDSGAASAEKQLNAERKLTESIDAQAKKLGMLADKRKELEASGLRDKSPEKFRELNSIIDSLTAKYTTQGNAVVQAQQKTAASAAKEVKIQEDRARAVAIVEAREQRALSSSLAGLDARIKAQQDYNRTIETLSKARFQGNVSGEEFSTYAKLAAARRDSTLALKDGSIEEAKAQRSLDQLLGSLDKSVKANQQYANAERQLQEAKRAGRISDEQYNNALLAATNKRDAALNAGVQQQITAEERRVTALNKTVAALDPVERATQQYNAQLKTLQDGLQTGAISQEQYNTRVGQAGDRLNSVRERAASLADREQQDFRNLVASIKPYGIELENLAVKERQLLAARNAGKFANDPKQYDNLRNVIVKERAELEKRAASLDKNTLSSKQLRQATNGLPAQFTDIVVSLQGGQAPLTVLLQQGGQLKDLFGGVGQAVRALGGYLLGLATNPVIVLGAAFATLIGGFVLGQLELNKLNKEILLTGSSFGGTANDVRNLASVMGTANGTFGETVDAIAALSVAGKGASENFNLIIQTALKLQRVAGVAAKETIDEFVKIGKDPVAAVTNLNDKYGILTASTYRQVKALVDAGREREATTLIEREAAQALEETTREIETNLNLLGKIARQTGIIFSNLGTAIKGIGQITATNIRLAEVETRILKAKDAVNRSSLGIFKDYNQEQLDSLEAERNKLLLQKEEEDGLRRQRSLIQDTNKRELSNAKEIENTRVGLLNSAERLNNERIVALQRLKDAEDSATASTVEGQRLIETAKLNVLGIEKKIAEEANKPKRGQTVPVDTRETKDLQNKLSVLRSQYSNYYKDIDSERKANQYSEEAAVNAKLLYLNLETEAVKAAYAEQIAALQTLAGRKGNTEAQNIKIANDLNKARADESKALAELETKKKKISADEEARLIKQTNNFNNYISSLKSSLDSLAAQGDQEAALVGLSSREAEQYNKRLALQAAFQEKYNQLVAQEAEGTLDPAQFNERLNAEREYLSKSLAQVEENARRKKAAEADWTNGAKAGFKNWADEAGNVSAQVEGVVGSAFNGMTDAVANFVTTGKLNFQSFAVSLLSEMAKIAVKIAASKILTSILGAFAGGAGTPGSSSFVGPLPQAKGGAWDGGVKKFAKGGAFTNSIYNQPTPFAMGGAFGGGLGVMGEAGPEAIMPLTRGPDGSLGVRAVGGAGGSGGVVVNISIASNGQTEVNSNSNTAQADQFGREIGAYVEQKYNELLGRDLKPGGQVYGAINSR